MTPQLFGELKVSKELAKALDRLGLEEASPVQAATVAAVLGKRSAVIATPPGSGRKLSLALAAVEGCESGTRAIQILLLTTTRERALQLASTIRSLTTGRKGLGCAVVVAGQSEKRLEAVLKDRPAILIGTPGRLREVLEGGVVSRDGIRMFLLDGADDLLEAGYADDLQALLRTGPDTRKILALATFISPDIEALAGEFCPDADRVVVPTAGMPPSLTWYDVESSGRLAALSLLADRHLIQRGLVFTNSPLTADELAGQLTAAGYPAEAVLSDLSAAGREKILKKFRSGDLTFLVTTDTALRGVETEAPDIVVHYEWPLDDGALAVRQAGLRPGGQGFALVSGRQVVRARAFSRRGSPARMGRLPVLSEGPEARLQASVARLRDALSVRNPAACRTIVDILIADGFEPAVIAGAAIRLLGSPTPPPQAVPAPLPVPAPVVYSPPPVVRATPMASPEEPVEEAAPVEDAVDWSPGVSTVPAGEYAETPMAEGSYAGDSGDPGSESGGDDSSSYSGGAYTADGYVITDNVSEDGVVYPPGANFGDEAAPDYGFGNGGGAGGAGAGGDRRRGVRRERGGRTRGRDGGGGGAGGGGAMAPGMKRLWLNVGRMDRIQPKDIVGCILGETGIPPVSIGRVQLFERHSLVDVSGSFESQIIEALNRTTVRGRKLKAKIAAY
ncbi:MAG: hypothetical protein RIS76_4597 [Verrucomicrobiota bacterium]|jgi:ATP-dependent RNA helicase DeaD